MARKRYAAYVYATTEPHDTEPSHWVQGRLFGPWTLASPQMTKALKPGGSIGGFKRQRPITSRQLARWRRQRPVYDA
jgi:hypothetical protein